MSTPDGPSTPLVHQAWQRCADRLLPPLARATLDDLFHRYLRDRYTESQRHYHNLQHLEEMLQYLAQYEREHGWHGACLPALSATADVTTSTSSSGSSPAVAVTASREEAVQYAWTGTVLLLAVLFHDAVYDPTRGDNEEASADLADAFLDTAAGLFTASASTEDSAVCGGVLWTDAAAAAFVRQATRDYILKTKVHLSVQPAAALHLAAPPSPSQVAESRDDPLHVFLDLDLSILGQADATVYEERYAANIQREYSHYPRADFVKGRAAFLRDFLSKPQWFKTPYFFALLERQARQNVAREEAQLAAEMKGTAAA